MNNMLTIEEVKRFLEVEQEEVEGYLKQGKLRAYKIGGTYIRFRKEEVINLRYEIKPPRAQLPKKPTFLGRLWEFWRFNNFYILSILIVAGILYWLLR